MPISTAQIPEHASVVIDALEAAGFEAWIVGGWVRDALLGNTAHDVDVCTSATWRESAHVLTTRGLHVHKTGIKHGTITAVYKGAPVEVTTYRVDGTYTDARHPDNVTFVDDVRADLSRRDFTINAMAYHPTRGLLDPFGGEHDLAKGSIKTVGDAQMRLNQDALRVLRAVRFAARLGFSIEPKTQAAIDVYAEKLAHVARERIGQELEGLLATGKLGWALMHEQRVLCHALPELKPLVDFDQKSPYHAYDVYEHTARVCDGIEACTAGLASSALRWAALFHDIAKPECFSIDESGRGHFFGHPQQGALFAKKTMTAMAVTKSTIEASCALIYMHDYQMNPTTKSVRRTLKRLDELFPGHARTLAFELLELKRADALAKAPAHRSYCYELDEVEHILRAELGEHIPFSVRDLAVGGSDVMRECSIEPGPEVGAVLASLLAAVRDDVVPNTREALLRELKTRY